MKTYFTQIIKFLRGWKRQTTFEEWRTKLTLSDIRDDHRGIGHGKGFQPGCYECWLIAKVEELQ